MDNELNYLPKLHDTLIEILNVVVEICERHKLCYFLAYGSCLGAARHNGFIPWDDDLDVGMPRKDYEMFVKICQNEMPDGYYYQGMENECKYWLLFGKIRKKNTVFIEEYIGENVLDKSKQGVYIDIFPYDGVKKINCRIKLIAWLIDKLKVILFLRAGTISEKSKKDIRTLISKIIPSTLAFRTYSFLIKSICSSNPKVFVSFSDPYPISKGWISADSNHNIALTKLKFAEKSYNVPAEYQKYLGRLYGDYMKLPSVEERLTHKPIKIDLGE